MSAAVVPLVTQKAVDEAWRDYHELVSECVRDPALWADRGQCEEIVRAWSRWSKLFIAMDGR